MKARVALPHLLCKLHKFAGNTLGYVGVVLALTNLAHFAIELQRSIRGPQGAVLKQITAREMIAPTGVGPFAVGFEIAKSGEGWYFSHSGGNWGFRCHLLAHVRKGYGIVIMTNGDSGGKLIDEVEARVAAAYNWDTLDKPVHR